MKTKILITLLMIFTLFLTSCAAVSTSKTAVLETNMGTIKIELFVEQMPITTSNFIKLAEEGFYDGTKFHRIVRKFMIQGGDPLSKDDSKKGSWGTGGPGYQIEDEFVEGLSNVRGTIAMANSGRENSGGSQFFINHADNSFLDFDKSPLASKHPVFGKVIEGMNVVDAIESVEKDKNDRPLEDVIIERIKII
jgi:peptidylprolyl isomerase